MSRSAGRRGSVLILIPVLASLVLALSGAVGRRGREPLRPRAGEGHRHVPRTARKGGGAADREVRRQGRQEARARQRSRRPRPEGPAQAARRGVRRQDRRARCHAPGVRPRVRQRPGRQEDRHAGRPRRRHLGRRRQGRGSSTPASTTSTTTRTTCRTVVDPEFLHNYKGGYDFFNNEPTRWTTTATARTSPASSPRRRTAPRRRRRAGRRPVRVQGPRRGRQRRLFGLIAALEWAVDHDIDVVNMSLGRLTKCPGPRRRRSHAVMRAA